MALTAQISKLTTKGQEVLARQMASTIPLQFTRLLVGDGLVTSEEQIEGLTDLLSFKKELVITSIQSALDNIIINAYIDNLVMTEGFRINELGLYLRDGSEDILLFYITYGETGQYLPTNDVKAIKTDFKLTVHIGGNATVEHVYPEDALVTDKDLNEAIEKLKKELTESEALRPAVPIGGVLFMWNNTNPATIYPGTTWDKIMNRYIKTSDGITPLVSGGNSQNKVTLTKENLPAVKIPTEAHGHGWGSYEIEGSMTNNYYSIFWTSGGVTTTGAYTMSTTKGAHANTGINWSSANGFNFQASRSATGTSASASPTTALLGNSVAFNIEPEYITLHTWRRLT